MYFESHAHYDDGRFDKDREEILNLLPSCGIDYVINVGCDMESSRKSIEMAEKYDYVYAAVGVHPHDAENMKESDLDELRQMSSHKKVVAIGEIGLDYYYDNSPRDVQRYWFKRQLELVKEVNKPVIIHSREASKETFDIIKESGVRKGVIHCYSGSAQMAKDYINMGFYIGIGGVITFSNAKKLVEVAETIQLEQILIETDSPYLSPIPNRGKRNDSRNLQFVVEKLAKIKDLTPEKVANITKLNTKQLFFK